MKNVALVDAYREACTALGETLVENRLLAAHADELQQQLAAHTADVQPQGD